MSEQKYLEPVYLDASREVLGWLVSEETVQSVALTAQVCVEEVERKYDLIREMGYGKETENISRNAEQVMTDFSTGVAEEILKGCKGEKIAEKMDVCASDRVGIGRAVIKNIYGRVLQHRRDNG